MKNVTITLEEDVLRWAKIWAARHDASVSRMLGEELRRKMLAEERYERARRRFQAKTPKPLKPANASFPDRDGLYDTRDDQPVVDLSPASGSGTASWGSVRRSVDGLPADPEIADDLEAVNRADRPASNPWD